MKNWSNENASEAIFMRINEKILSPAPPGAFTIVVLPDSQGFAEQFPEDFLRITDWIVGHIEDQRIVFCSHVGDLVEN